jgi:hypothetical protein
MATGKVPPALDGQKSRRTKGQDDPTAPAALGTAASAERPGEAKEGEKELRGWFLLAYPVLLASTSPVLASLNEEVCIRG